MTQAIRSLALRVNKELALRTETYQDREYLVVPVIALVETVVFAGNADAPEFVPAEEVTDEKFVSGFNGRPVFSGHPQNEDGQYLMGNQPSVLEEKQIGIVFNARAANGKLKLEAWLDVERVKLIEPTLLARIEENDSEIEVSVGVFVDTEAKSGTHDGKRYAGVWHNIVPDHLAILPLGQIGACSVEQGCGLRAATKGTVMNTISRTLFFRSAVEREQMSDNDLRMKLYLALREKLGSRACGYVEAVYGNLVVYTTFDDMYEMEMYRRGYALSESGVVSLSDDEKKVEPRTVYDEVPEETPAARAAHSCSCQSKRTAETSGETPMKNLSDALKAHIEAATPAQIAAMEAVFAAPVVAETKVEAPAAAVVTETPAPVAAPVTEAPAAVAEAPVVASAKAPTLDELLALASPEMKAAYENIGRAAAAAKATAVKTLRDSGRCDLSDAELNAKPQTELDALVKLASANLSAASVDFSGQGVTTSRAAEQTTEVAAPPDMSVAIRAANAATAGK